jgi:hypothetical protein
MKTQVNFSTFQSAFENLRPNNFSYEGLTALYDYLIQLEEDTGEEIELDVIALCCDYSELTELEIRDAYGLSDSDSSTEFIQNHSFIVGTTDKTVIFQNF